MQSCIASKTPFQILIPSSVQDAFQRTRWSYPSPPLPSSSTSFGQFFHYSISFLSFPSGNALLHSSHPFSPSMSICRSLSSVSIPLSFLVLSSHFSLIFPTPGSGRAADDFSQRSGVHFTQPNFVRTFAFCHPYNG